MTEESYFEDTLWKRDLSGAAFVSRTERSTCTLTTGVGVKLISLNVGIGNGIIDKYLRRLPARSVGVVIGQMSRGYELEVRRKSIFTEHN